jgi:hypothetical protein
MSEGLTSLPILSRLKPGKLARALAELLGLPLVEIQIVKT